MKGKIKNQWHISARITKNRRLTAIRIAFFSIYAGFVRLQLLVLIYIKNRPSGRLDINMFFKKVRDQFPDCVGLQSAAGRIHNMDCAAACGITVPETKLMDSRVCSGYFAVRRFDREKTNGQAVRRHMLTAAAILEVDWRNAALDYHTLMKLTKILSLGNERDMEQMFRRMCFNVFAHNRDDHAKNFSWMYDEQMDCWHPSPAYDLTFSTTYFGEHTTTVDGNGKNPGMKELLAVGKAAGMAPNKCRMIAEEIWVRTRPLAEKYGN